jgi:glycosyltransferase involved in cell wall biosynthesis
VRPGKFVAMSFEATPTYERHPPGQAAEARAASPRTAAVPGGVTVVIPAYNEEAAIAQEIDAVFRAMQATARPFKVIVVDDGSTDGTASRIAHPDVQVIRQRTNRGYGASLKRGIAAATTELIVITDADGTYPADAIPRLLREADECDMVVGARSNWRNVPFVRRPAKAFLRSLAVYLSERDIPDLNSGLRVLRKSLVLKYEHILPPRFSFTTTITLALMCNNYDVRFVEIDYRERIGQSKVRSADALQFFLLVIRTITLFNPLRVFLPLGSIPFVGGVLKLAYDLTGFNVSDGAIMGMLSALIIWSVGILADMTSRAVLGLGRS